MTLLQMLAASLAINGVFFALALALRTDVFTDITYSLSFVALSASLALAARGGSLSPAGIVAVAMVTIWAIRLGSYLFYRILHIKVDHRFDDKRDSFVRFGSFWLLQAITVWVVMLPVYGIVSSARSATVPAWLVACSVAVFAVGLAIEAVADAQKYRFKSDPANSGKFMSTGLWRLSRHPNYFGEMLVWWAVAIPGVYVFRGLGLLYFIGPAFISFLLLFVSGVPLLERSAEEKWGSDEAYRRYRRATSLVVPLPPRKGA